MTTCISYEDILPAVSNQILGPILEKLESATRTSISRNLQGKYAIAYSAGIDSSILAKIASDELELVTLLTLGGEGSSDLLRVGNDSLANGNRFRLIAKTITPFDIQRAALEVSRFVTVSSLSHFEDCVSFWLVASNAKEIAGVEYIASANGPDELFCGYDRFRRLVDEKGYHEAEKEISKALRSAALLQRQVRELISRFGYDTIEPFLDKAFIEFSLQVPIEYKILMGNDFLRKRIWRCLGRRVGVSDSTVLQRKKAMQYGMGIHPIVLSLVRKKKIEIGNSFHG